jgi:hypothetical protein
MPEIKNQYQTDKDMKNGKDTGVIFLFEFEEIQGRNLMLELKF